MRYQHTVAYWIKGLYPQQEGTDEEIVSSVNFRAILTNSPNSYCLHGDRINAISKLQLDIFLGQLQPGTFQERIESVVSKIRESRQQRFGAGLFLTCIENRNTEDFGSVSENESEDFIVRYGVELKEVLQQASRDNIPTLLSALTLSIPNVLGFVKIIDFVVFYRDDSKPIYCPALPSISGEAYSAPRITQDTINSIQNLHERCRNLTAANKEFGRVQHLLTSSLLIKDDRLSSFRYAFTALERFIKMVFREYESVFFQRVKNESHSDALEQYLKRILDVMRDKYGLSDKFALIAFILSNESVDEDVKKFKVSKKKRDNLFHGEDIVESDLPVEEIQTLARKYFRLHLER